MAMIGYARCSTNDSRQDVERQIRDLTDIGAEPVFNDYASGAADGRAGLSRALAALCPGDVLAATEVSRLTRRLGKLLDVIDAVEARKAKIRIGAVEFDASSGKIAAMQLAMLQMMGVFAELERNLTIERIGSGVANARAKGVRLGRPKKSAKDVPQAVIDMRSAYQAGEITKAGYAKACGISRPTLDKYLKLLECLR